MDCPRKAEATMAVQLAHETHWREDGTCSYCGSLSQEKFFEAVERECRITPTDKNYKVYVDLPNPDVGQPAIYSSANFEKTDDGWIKVTLDNVEALPIAPNQRDFYLGQWVKVEPAHETLHRKFYFQHLSQEGRDRFIELVNAKRINFANPGYLYVMPYFAKALAQ